MKAVVGAHVEHFDSLDRPGFIVVRICEPKRGLALWLARHLHYELHRDWVFAIPLRMADRFQEQILWEVMREFSRGGAR